MGKRAVVGDPNVVVAYLRVSTEEQVISGAGLDAQATAIDAEVDRRGWVLLRTYKDRGLSGKDMKTRPELRAALEAVESGEAGTLVVAKLDRLSRSLVDFAHLMERAQQRGYNIVALDLGIDLASPAGEFLASVMASAAQWERRIIGERTKAGLAEKRRAGVQLGRRPVLSRNTARLVAELRAAHTLSETARILNERGVATARPRPDGSPGRWGTSSVAQVAEAYARGVYDGPPDRAGSQ